ncbi:hypothetical protein FPCIR_11668 [Fusarium pseudocircinatum]|uniref:Nephrocystin 3-like N-terminal domain-containing protein n=1 Tax=Fusarium pseudocircinatum TaxID=56676 RepID=A0A8H5KPU9_9HYPO|nr:hypothetical protein FPCIR_11668 [Fusarium pseudocircinatum]
MASQPLRTMVFFDLDNTLFDHQKSLDTAMALVRTRFPLLRQISLARLTEKYNKALNLVYDRYLRNEIAHQDQDREKLKLFFKSLDLEEPDSECIARFRNLYKTGYRMHRSAMPGGIQTLRSLRQNGYRTAIITNGPTESQIEKAKDIGVFDLVECVITSEEAGHPKPDVRIFQYAMENLGVEPDNAFMVGDSVEADIKGALDAKITPILYSPSSNSSFKMFFGQEISVICQFDQLDMNSRWHDITPAVDGTCKWIFSNPEYKKWAEGDGHRLFWIKGSPGCGKSTLFKCLRDSHSAMMTENSGLKVVFVSASSFLEDFDSVGQAISATNERDPDRDWEVFPRGKTNLIHIAARMGLAYLFDALTQESLGKQKLKQDVLDFNTEDDYGYTVLHLAAVRGNEQIVKQIIFDHHFTKKPLNLRPTIDDDDFGAPVVDCPLLMALFAGHGSVAQLLLDHGREHGTFDPSKISFGYSLGYSIRLKSSYAAFNMPRYVFNLTKPLRIAGELVEGNAGSSQTRPREEKGWQIAIFIRRKLQPVGQWLMEDPDEAIFETIGYLLDDVNFDYIEADIPVGNALHLMAENGSLEMVKILVASGRVDINASNPFNLTPLAFAAKENHDEVVYHLLQQGAMPYTNDSYLFTPLFCALSAQNEGGERVIRALLRQDIPENSSQIALHLTAAKLLGDDKLVESCVSKKPKLLRPFAHSLEKKTWPED